MGDAAASPTSSSPQPPVRSGLPSAHPTASFWQTSFPNRLAGHRSTPELPSRADVVVVGTGISGTFAVDELLNSNGSTATSSRARRGTEAETAAIETGLGLDVLVLEARTLCSAATGRNGGHLQPVIHNAPAHIIDFELRNFRHIEALVRSRDKASDDGSSNSNTCDNDTTTTKTSSSSSPSPSWCDFRRLEGCLGFWNKEYFRDAKRGLAAAAAVAAAANVDKNKNGIPPEDYAGLARVVEDAEELGALGLRVESGAVGAIVQSVAASLSPYKLCVGVWRGLLERFEQKVVPGSHEKERAVPKQRKSSLNLQTNTPVTALERCHNDNDSGGCWILHTPRGSVRARAVILATNAYTSHLLPEFARLIRPVQAQMSALVPPPTSKHGNGSGGGGRSGMTTNTRKARKLIPMSYGFMGVGDMDRVMSDYLVQNPYAIHHHHHGCNHQENAAEQAGTGKDDEGVSSEGDGAGGHLMFGGGRHLAPNHGEGVWDDDFVDDRVEMYLRGLPQRLKLSLDPDLNLHLRSEPDSHPDLHLEPGTEDEAHLAIAASWTGIIGHSSDGHPWVGAVPDHANRGGAFVVAGYTGHGMTNAPLCGRGVARMALRYLLRADVDGKADSGTDGDGDENGDGDVDVPKEYLITRERMDRVAIVV
ncbi:uncharacterized protein A1O5_01109 [Cladophialophora psammophila CBS 110553]|uniref:FAD dependent oxidoreductase domain-containing protein n=1 Tax=Cladophialophora psammophila CBS 110553 TaxID=1182543 RepID=W9XI15_9EURO|nr:uncharacterized protein A1O5_01109 [Cladophialophora psammophila CBS 110553]EXJ76601.1 hypothetical protein A1O5_01109 [Cladophialophora psammophila CBS 110553]